MLYCGILDSVHSSDSGLSLVSRLVPVSSSDICDPVVWSEQRCLFVPLTPLA